MKIISLITILLLSVSCSSDKAGQTKINALEVSDKLVKGKTTRAQVLETFGSPDVVEKTAHGDMWAYNRYSNENDSLGGGISHSVWNAGLWNLTGFNVGADQSKSSTKTASLVVYFDLHSILENYTFRTEKY